jgi:sulfate adenylyltransferase
MYAKARQGLITGFTGVDDPYEAPVNPEITLDTVNFTPEQNAAKIVEYLEANGFLPQTAVIEGNNGSNGHKTNGNGH